MSSTRLVMPLRFTSVGGVVQPAAASPVAVGSVGTAVVPVVAVVAVVAVGSVTAGVVAVVAGVVVVVSAWRPAALSPTTAPATGSPTSLSVADESVVATVVVVDPPAVVEVVPPGALVDVVEEEVASAPVPGTGRTWHTGRNRSSAVWPTRSSARLWFSTPGSCTRMVSPCREMSGSATPSASTRLLMMSMAWSSWSLGTSFAGCRTTDTPP